MVVMMRGGGVRGNCVSCVVDGHNDDGEGDYVCDGDVGGWWCKG